MDLLEERKQDEGGKRPEVRFGDISKSVRSRGPGLYGRWGSQPEKPASAQRRRDSIDDSEPHEPKLVQLNMKSTLLGVQISDDDDDLFFSRKSSTSSMLSEKFRSSAARPFKWDSEPRRTVEQPKAKIDVPSSPLMPPLSSRGNSGLLFPQPSSAFKNVNPQESARLRSGLLYPCPNPGSRPNSCQLNAALFTFDNNLLTSEHEATTSTTDDVTERIFKKLVGQSRFHESNSKGVDSGGNLDARSIYINSRGDNLSVSPVSILDVPQSPTSSERSFRDNSKRKSLRSRSDDANSLVAAQGGLDPATPRPKSQLAEYLMSISALAEGANDEDDLEGPSEVAWLEPDDNPYHPEFPVVEGYTSAHGKIKPTHERWSSNSSSWNLSLVQKPLRTVSTIVGRRQHQHATVPGRSSRKGNRRGKVDAIMPISYTMSYDGGTTRSRTAVKATRSELNSERSWWPELGSGRRSSVFASSGRLQMEVSAEPDLHEPDMEQANNVNSRWQQDARTKVEEEDVPFDNPVASSFVFQEAVNSGRSAGSHEQSDSRAALHKAVNRVIDSENDELLFSDNCHDPEDGSITDSDGSHTFSLEGERQSGLLDQPPQWVSSRSFDYLRDMVDIGLSGRDLGSMSGSCLSGFLEPGRSGRFSVDLQRGPKIDKVERPRTPDVRLRIFKSERSSKRSILSPCLPFLHRSQNKDVRRLKQAPAPAASSQTAQRVNSFTSRLGPVSDNPRLSPQF